MRHDLLDDDLGALLGKFNHVSLKEAMSVNLNSRKELKFVLSRQLLLNNIQALINEYAVQRNFVGGYYNKYSTRYWDTTDKNYFNDHVRGKNNRIKVRKRLYEDTGEVMIEIKRKKNDRTIKSRASSSYSTDLNVTDVAFLSNNKILTYDLQHTLDTYYNRITFWNASMTGRITVDFDYGIGFGSSNNVFQNTCIVELKGSSDFLMSAVKSFSFPIYRYQSSFSKYAIGIIHHYKLGPEKAKGFLKTYKKLSKINFSS